MDAADTGFDHLCGTHRPRHHELRRGVGKEEGGPRITEAPFQYKRNFCEIFVQKAWK
jgi:hypothetical protein